MKYYEILVNETGRAPYTKAPFEMFNEHKERFATVELAQAYLTEHYGEVKQRQPMYVDKKDGEAVNVGYIYHFRNSDISHNSEEWIQEDWVEVREVVANPILLKA